MSGEVGTQLSSVCRKRSLVSWCRPGTRLLTISAQLTAFPAARPEPENTTCLVLPPSKRPSASPSRFRILLPSRTRISRVSGGSWGIGDEAGSSTEPALRYCSILPSRRWWVSLWICTRSPVDARPSRSSQDGAQTGSARSRGAAHAERNTPKKKSQYNERLKSRPQNFIQTLRPKILKNNGIVSQNFSINLKIKKKSFKLTCLTGYQINLELTNMPNVSL